MKIITEDIFYGDSRNPRIALSLYDELLLREALEDRDRWTRITPAGKEQYEPLFETIERIDSKHCVVTPGPYVGKVKLRDSELRFLPPKWLKGLDSSHIIYMLVKSNPFEAKATYLPEFIGENPTSVSELTEPLYSFFVSELFRATKKGIYRTYEQQKLISPRLRGRLDFPRQISLNSRAKAMFATEQQVFSEDNDVNKLLSLANKVVLEKSIINNTLETAQQIKKNFPVASNIKLANMKRTNLARRGYHFRTSIELAKLIISGESISYEGDLSNTFSMVINLFDLFEKYISSELFVRDKNYNSQFHLPLVDPSPIDTPWNRRKVYPDIVYLDKIPKLAVDIKLKQINEFGPKIEDIYQIFFYSNVLNLSKGVLIYPTSKKVVQLRSFPISHSGINKLELITYGLPIAKPINEMKQEIDDLHQFLSSLKKP